jgi:hypothetical protein
MTARCFFSVGRILLAPGRSFANRLPARSGSQADASCMKAIRKNLGKARDHISIYQGMESAI